MSIAEKLTQIAENELKVYESGKQSVYETIVFAQDCTNSHKAWNILSATMAPEDKIVMFVNKAWTSVPDADTVNNQGLWMLCVSKEFNRPNETSSMWARFRNGSYSVVGSVNEGYDYTVSAGDEWLKVVLV